MSPVKFPHLIKQFMFTRAGTHNTPLSSLKLAKMGMSLCDVIVTLKLKRKIVNLFFLKQDTFFLQENVCLTLVPKNAHGITQGPTLQAVP